MKKEYYFPIHPPYNADTHLNQAKATSYHTPPYYSLFPIPLFPSSVYCGSPLLFHKIHLTAVNRSAAVRTAPPTGIITLFIPSDTNYKYTGHQMLFF